MRTSILIGIRHAGDSVLIAGPEVPLVEQNDMMRDVLAEGSVNGEFSEVQRWESDSGIHRIKKFRSPEAEKAHREQQVKDTAAHEAQLKNEREAGKPKTKPKQAKPDNKPKAPETPAPATGKAPEVPPPDAPKPTEPASPEPPAAPSEAAPETPAPANGDWE